MLWFLTSGFDTWQQINNEWIETFNKSTTKASPKPKFSELPRHAGFYMEESTIPYSVTKCWALKVIISPLIFPFIHHWQQTGLNAI